MTAGRMLLALLASAALVACAAGDTTATLDPTKGGLPYDGHGALSAGASSRLLYDYAEPHRSNILDFLFKVRGRPAYRPLKIDCSAG